MNSHKKDLCLFLAMASVGLVGCGPPSALTPKTGVIATIGGNELTTSELLGEAARLRAKGLEPEARKLLDDLVLREVLVARARQLGLEQDPEVIRDYKNLLIASLKARELEPKLTNAQGARVQNRPESTPSTDFAAPRIEQIRLAMLRQGLPAKASSAKAAELARRMTEARERAIKLPLSEAGFGILAIEFSDDQASRYHGGDLGWLVEDAGKLRYDPVVLRAAFALKSPGEISPVIRGRDGLYLVRLLARRALDSETQQPTATQGMDYRERMQKRNELEHAFEREARAQVQVSIFEERLSALDLAAGPKPVVSPQL